MTGRKFLYAFFFIFSGFLISLGLESGANDCRTTNLSRIYTGDLNKDIFIEVRECKINWDINHHPLRYQKSKKESLPQPAAKQFIDKTKRKGIAASGPEPANPAFTGFFPGYPPDSKCEALRVTILLSSPEIYNNSRIRPPPVS